MLREAKNHAQSLAISFLMTAAYYAAGLSVYLGLYQLLVSLYHPLGNGRIAAV
jgi:hypothetical protein